MFISQTKLETYEESLVVAGLPIPVSDVSSDESLKQPDTEIQQPTLQSSCTTHQRKQIADDTLLTPWIAYESKRGIPFYYNPETNVTTWDRPRYEQCSILCKFAAFMPQNLLFLL